MSNSEENIDDTYEDANSEDKPSTINENITKILDASIENAIEQYRKVRQGDKVELTEKEIAEIDKECEIISCLLYTSPSPRD